LHEVISQALTSYKEEVEQGLFPKEEHTFSISDEEWELFLEQVGED
jgi:ketopantoate hydroxymethyltransferase